MTGDYPAATLAAEQALDIYRDLGHWHGQAGVLRSLGVVRLAIYPHLGVLVTTYRVENWFGIGEMMNVPLPLAMQSADHFGIEAAT